MIFGRIDFGSYAEVDDRFRRAKGLPEVRCHAHTFGTSSVYPAAHGGKDGVLDYRSTVPFAVRVHSPTVPWRAQRLF